MPHRSWSIRLSSVVAATVVAGTGALALTPPEASATMLSPVASGVSSYPLPDRPVPGQENGGGAVSTSRWNQFPYQRFEANGVSAGSPVSWSGSTVNRNELQLVAWDHAAGTWSAPLAAASPSSPGGSVALTGTLKSAHVRDGAAKLLVLDGPRTSTAFADANRRPDRAFADPSTYDFSLLHMTDTQYLAEGFESEFNAMTSWTAENAAKYKIGYVQHTGDIIQNWIMPGTDPAVAHKEFRVASKAMARLDGVVPYGVLPGNHDNLWNLGSQVDPNAHRNNHQIYNQHFGPQRFRDRPYWGGSFTPTDNSANYQLTEIAGAKFLFLNIGYNPTPAMLSWAEGVLRKHPHHNAVIGTHYYLDENGQRAPRRPVDLMAGSGDEVFHRLVVPFENVFLVLTGHIHAQATKIDHKIGRTGRTVVQLLADYQSFEVGGDKRTGFQRLLQFDIDSQTMAVTTHSPVLNSFDVHKYDPDRRYGPRHGEFVQKVSLRGDVPRAVK